jgi:hypothetical protein
VFNAVFFSNLTPRYLQGLSERESSDISGVYIRNFILTKYIPGILQVYCQQVRETNWELWTLGKFYKLLAIHL